MTRCDNAADCAVQSIARRAFGRMARVKLRKVRRIVVSFWDWWGIAGTLVKLSIPTGAVGGGIVAWLDGLNVLQTVLLVVASAFALPFLVWAFIHLVKVLGQVLSDKDEPGQALIMEDIAGVVAGNSPMTQTLSGETNRQFGQFNGVYNEAASVPSTADRTRPDASVIARGNEVFVRVVNPGDADHYTVKLSNFAGGAPHLVLSPAWRNGSDDIEIKRGDNEECRIMASATVPSTGFWDPHEFSRSIKNANVTFFGGSKVQTVTVEKLRPWAVTVSVTSTRGEPVGSNFTYAVTSRYTLIMPYTAEALEAEEERIRLEVQQTLEQVRVLTESKEGSPN